MRFYGDVVKMPDNPTKGRPGLTGLFQVVIYYDEGHGSIENWREYEIMATDVSYEQGLQIERNRLDELKEQYRNAS